MRIPVLFLIEHLSDGGSERHVRDVARLLDPHRYEAHVIFFSGGLMSNSLANYPHVQVQQFPPLRKTFSGSFVVRVLMLRRYMRARQIRVIVTFHFLADLLGTITAATLRNVVVVSSRRDMGITRSYGQRQVGCLLRFRVNRYIAVSEAVGAAIRRQEGIPGCKIVVIYNGISLDELLDRKWNVDKERTVAGFDVRDTVIACIANFNPVKGHHTLIRAFGQLCERLPRNGLRLLLAGDGPERTSVEREVAAMGLGGKVVFRGHSPDPTREYGLADIVVSPSDTEGFSNTVVESMACGKAVVATSVGGTPEAIKSGINGLLVPPGDPRSLADALELLVLGRDIRRRLGTQAARDAAARFSRDRMVSEIQRVIDEVIEV